MRSLDIIRLLQLMRAAHIESSPDGHWVRCSCPMAPVTHASGSDSHPSFGIKVNDGGLSNYNCFTCGGGTISGLIHKMTWTLGISQDVHEFFMAREFLPEEASRERFAVDYIDSIAKVVPQTKPVPVPDMVLEEYPLLREASGYECNRVKEWLDGRGIDYDIACDYQIRISPDERAIIFPVVDTDGLTYLLHARSRVDKKFYYLNPSNTGFPTEIWGRKDFWFGINKVDFKKPLLLVESETDLLRLRTLGIPNVLASCGPVGDYKLGRIDSTKTYLGFDSDLGGAQYTMRTAAYLSSSSSLFRLHWNLVGHKDAGDLVSRNEFEKVMAKPTMLYFDGPSLMMDKSYNEPVGHNDTFARRKEVMAA